MKPPKEKKEMATTATCAVLPHDACLSPATVQSPTKRKRLFSLKRAGFMTSPTKRNTDKLMPQRRTAALPFLLTSPVKKTPVAVPYLSPHCSSPYKSKKNRDSPRSRGSPRSKDKTKRDKPSPKTAKTKGPESAKTAITG